MHASVHLSKAVVVDEIRSVSVNQSVEGETVLPAEGEKTHLNNGRHGRKCCSLIKGTSIIKPVNDVVYHVYHLFNLIKKETWKYTPVLQQGATCSHKRYPESLSADQTEKWQIICSHATWFTAAVCQHWESQSNCYLISTTEILSSIDQTTWLIYMRWKILSHISITMKQNPCNLTSPPPKKNK